MGLDRLLVELVNVRVSQLNGCGFCLDLHVRRAVKNGETPQRLAVLPAWRDVELFSPTEQAALALAETITVLPGHHERERERTRARKHLTDDQYSAVSWLSITMNAFNPISIISGHPVRPRPPDQTRSDGAREGKSSQTRARRRSLLAQRSGPLREYLTTEVQRRLSTTSP